MPVLYRLLQDKREKSSTKGEWYARSITNGTVDTNGLAKIIERNCSLTKADVLAALSALTDTMSDLLRNSKRVKIDGFGSFKIGLNTKYAPTPGEFTVKDNVVGSHIIFQPERHTSINRTQRRVFLDDLRLEETAKNDVRG